MQQIQIQVPTRDEVLLVFALAKQASLGDPDVLRIIAKVSDYQKYLWLRTDQMKQQSEEQTESPALTPPPRTAKKSPADAPLS